jgi:Ca2+ transporting ATPase
MIAAEEGNGMAYISSWGEANPGGGKDRVQLFIERAKNNVIQARDSLSTMVDIFDLKQT